MAEIFKFPYDASRRVHSQKPRRSKNGTPETGGEGRGNAAAGCIRDCLERPTSRYAGG